MQKKIIKKDLTKVCPRVWHRAAQYLAAENKVKEN